jgi:hypothetical protein
VASAGCVIVVAAFESPAIVAGLDDIAMVGQAVEQRGCYRGVAEHAGPFAEGEIGGDDHGRALVDSADEMEQELVAGLSERQVAPNCTNIAARLQTLASAGGFERSENRYCV